MVLGHLISLAVISGIFSRKHEELDILPPPPPFPEIGIGEKQREAKGARKKEEKQREKELELRRKKEKEEGRKKEGRKQRELKLKEGQKKKKEEKQKLELEKKKPERKDIFGEFFGKKKEKPEFVKELEELEKITPKPEKKEKKKAKLGIPELISLKTEEIEKKIAKPEEVVKVEEEIQKAISGIKKAKRPSVIKSLFKRKKEPVAVEGMTETPTIMPRTYDKIDHIELIEEKIHKARLMLMDFRFDEAKRVYIEIMKLYNELEPKKKSKVYQDVKDLYYERKSAEKFVK